MASLRFAKLQNQLIRRGISYTRKSVSPVTCKSFITCFDRTLCSSAPRPSGDDSDSRAETTRATIRADDGRMKVIDLKGTEIKSVQAPRIPPSSHVEVFQQALSEGKNPENFIKVLESFCKTNRPRRGHMEFVQTSMDFMDKFGLEKDLESYNAMLNVFPRDRFKNLTLLDAIWPKKHPQVDLALEILTKMEENVIKPSLETYDLCEEIFGRASQPVQKCRRLAYWLTKLEEMFPHPLPKVLPEDELELSQLALVRMTKQSIPVVIYQDDIEGNGISFIVGSQTGEQKAMLENYDIGKPVYVEGPNFLWIRRLKRHFYTLRTHTSEGNEEDTDEGAVLAVCMTSSCCSQDTLNQWISKLQDQTPNLSRIQVIFNLRTNEANDT